MHFWLIGLGQTGQGLDRFGWTDGRTAPATPPALLPCHTLTHTTFTFPALHAFAHTHHPLPLHTHTTPPHTYHHLPLPTAPAYHHPTTFTPTTTTSHTPFLPLWLVHARTHTHHTTCMPALPALLHYHTHTRLPLLCCTLPPPHLQATLHTHRLPLPCLHLGLVGQTEQGWDR